jgi:hypothetical protein
MTEPNDQGSRAEAGSAGAAVDEHESPWERAPDSAENATNVFPAVTAHVDEPVHSDRPTGGHSRSTDWSQPSERNFDQADVHSRTTTELPQVAGDGLYQSRDQRVDNDLRRTTTPPNAVDQYAAMTADPYAVTAAVGGPINVATNAPSIPAPPVATLPPAMPAVTKAAKAPKRPKVERAPRRARLQLKHLNVWSVLKFSCVLAIALFFVWLIIVGILYGVLQGMGVFNKINDTVRTIDGTNTKDVVTSNIIFGGAFVIGLVNIVLFIVLSTIGSVVYNLCADLVGGIEVTLSERD